MGARPARVAVALVCAVLAASAGREAVAEDVDDLPRGDPAVETRIEKLETPPSLESVEALVHMSAVKSDRASALRVVGVLWHAGGHASAAGLRHLVKSPEDPVRLAALRAVTHVGIRLREGFDAVRAAGRDESSKEIRTAALEAMGRVGDAQDLPVLLAAAREDDPQIRTAAFRALSDLTGQRMPAEPARWTAWWTETEPETPKRLDAAFATLSSDGEEVLRTSALSTVERFGWAGLERVKRGIQELLRSGEAKRRADGFRLALAVRLGDLADEVSSGFRYERHPDVWPVAREAAALLGTPTKGVTAPEEFVPDRRFDR